MNVYIAGQQVKLTARNAIGKGGEADVYAFGRDKVVKIWKGPNHADFAADPQEQKSAKARIQLYQKKLRDFPGNLPRRLIAPLDAATDRNGRRILGFSMPRVDGAEVLLRYGEPRFRQTGPGYDRVRRMLLDLHQTVVDIHRAGVVIGDFNDLNVLVRDDQAFVIDADSIQFGKYPCSVYTTRFVDPLLCDPHEPLPVLKQTHNEASDWYAFSIMVMQCWLMVGPYGGIYRPGKSSARVPHDARPLHRITVFDPDVRYPKPAVKPDVLPDEWIDYFRATFEDDRRGMFPKRLLEDIRWQQCGHCGLAHSRVTCPRCSVKSHVPVPAMHVASKATVTPVAYPPGVLLDVAVHNGRCLWLSLSAETVTRESGEVVADRIQPGQQFKIQGERTWCLDRGQLSCRRASVEIGERFLVDAGVQPSFAVNSQRAFWTSNDGLYGSTPLGSEFIGQVLSPQTRIWTGEKLGFGLCLAGELRLGFLFDTRRPGINDQVAVPRFGGQLIDIDCYCSDDQVWIFSLVQYAGQSVHRCHLVDRHGQLIASAENVDQHPWLAAMHGNLAYGSMLLVSTDDGIARVQANGGAIAVTRVFADTESHVEADTILLPGPSGLFAARNGHIDLIQV